MIYVDSSVALARLFGEDRQPPSGFWEETLISSRLLQYEVWSRANQRPMSEGDREAVTQLLRGIEYAELYPFVLERALTPFPTPLKTLDGLHAATMDFLQRQGRSIELATYDVRLAAAAEALGIVVRRL